MKPLLIVISLTVFSLAAFGNWAEEKKKIDYLLGQVSNVQGVFIRNGTEHSPEAAVKHLTMKLNNALSSWFTPSKKRWTAQLFIDKVASKSSLSGKKYQLRLSTGELIDAKEWFAKELKSYKSDPK